MSAALLQRQHQNCSPSCSSNSPPEAAVYAVQIEVTGPDSKAIKSTYAAFHTFKNGRTTLSCSGLLLLPSNLQQQQCTVLAPLSSIYPFLQQQHRTQLSQVTAASLLPGVAMSVLLRDASPQQQQQQQQLVRLPAQLESVLHLPDVHAAAHELLMSVNSSSVGTWKLGWCLADQQPLESATPSLLSHLAVLTVQPSTLQHSTQQQQQQQHDPFICTAPAAVVQPKQQQQQQPDFSSRHCSCKGAAQPGLPVVITGSPFGCLAAQQFHGAVITGVISQVLQRPQGLGVAGAGLDLVAAAAGQRQQQQGTSRRTAAAAAACPMFAVDARVMPGMEGGAVRCRGLLCVLHNMHVLRQHSIVGAVLLLAAALPPLTAPWLTQCGLVWCCCRLLGVLSLPLSNSSSQVELYLAIPISHVQAAAAAATGETAAAVNEAKLYRLVGGLQLDCELLDSSVQQQQQQQRLSLPSSSSSSISSMLAGPDVLQQPQQQGIYRSATLESAAAAAAVHNAYYLSPSSSSSSSAAALQAAQSGVVLIRVGRSWGSGVIITTSGLVLTNAHLFKSGSSSSTGDGGNRSSSSSSKGRGVQGREGWEVWPKLQQTADDNLSSGCHSSRSSSSSSNGRENPSVCHPSHDTLHMEDAAATVRLHSLPAAQSAAAALRGNSSSGPWVPARLLYRFQGYLDLAVLQLVLPAHSSSSSSSSKQYAKPGPQQQQQQQQQQQLVLHPLQLCDPDQDVSAGSDVYVIGHGLFGPAANWLPAVTGGCTARIVTLPSSSSSSSSSGSGTAGSNSRSVGLQLHPAVQPQQQQRHSQHGYGTSSSSSKASMLITTAAVHGGASGGALVNSQGQLVGVVTSNAKHARGTTLPHCNFCIAADELRPIWEWAKQQEQRWQQQQQGRASANATSSSSSSSSGGGHFKDITPAAAAEMLRELQALDVTDNLGVRSWALQQPVTTLNVPSASSSGSGNDGGGGGGGGAAAAAVFDQLAEKLQGRAALRSKI